MGRSNGRDGSEVLFEPQHSSTERCSTSALIGPRGLLENGTNGGVFAPRVRVSRAVP